VGHGAGWWRGLDCWGTGFLSLDTTRAEQSVKAMKSQTAKCDSTDKTAKCTHGDSSTGVAFSPPAGTVFKAEESFHAVRVDESDRDRVDDSLHEEFSITSVTAGEWCAQIASCKQALFDDSFASVGAASVGDEIQLEQDLFHVLEGDEECWTEDHNEPDFAVDSHTASALHIQCAECSSKIPAACATECVGCGEALCEECLHGLAGSRARHDIDVLLRTKGGTFECDKDACILCFRQGEPECCCADGGSPPIAAAAPPAVVWFDGTALEPRRWQNRKHGREIGCWDYCPECNAIRCPSCSPQVQTRARGEVTDAFEADYNHADLCGNHVEKDSQPLYPGCRCTQHKFGQCFCDRKLAHDPQPIWRSECGARSFVLTVPAGCFPGDIFLAKLDGIEMTEVRVPAGKLPGHSMEWTMAPCIRRVVDQDGKACWEQGFWSMDAWSEEERLFSRCGGCERVVCDDCSGAACSCGGGGDVRRSCSGVDVKCAYSI
jgi:hypothetical protein